MEDWRYSATGELDFDAFGPLGSGAVQEAADDDLSTEAELLLESLGEMCVVVRVVDGFVLETEIDTSADVALVLLESVGISERPRPPSTSAGLSRSRRTCSSRSPMPSAVTRS